MTLILVTIIFGSGLLAALQAVNHITRCKVYARGNLVLIDIVVVVMYALVAGLVALFEIYSGYNPMVLYAALALVVLVLAFFFGKIYVDHPRGTNRKMLVVLGLYLCVVAYVTLFIRIGTVDKSIRTVPFDDLQQAFLQRDPEMAMHFFLNVAMFIPLGILIPATNPKYLGRCSFAMLGGLVASTVIEGAQLVFKLGQSDVDDILANTLGAVLGYGLTRFIWQVQKNWRI